MAFGINIKEMTAQMIERFDKLYAVLLEIRDELRTRLPPPPDQTMTGPQ